MQDIPSPIGSYYQLAGNTSGGYRLAWNSSLEFDHQVTSAMQSSFLAELGDIFTQLRPFPSLVTFILFNEVSTTVLLVGFSAGTAILLYDAPHNSSIDCCLW